MNITIFCSSNDVGEPYTSAAREFARLIGMRGYALVWGGSDKGTMREIADAAEESGAKLIGVSVEKLRADAREGVDEMSFAKDWPERRAMLLAKGDALVVLPGGIGTLDEASEVLEYKKQDLHQKPIVFLNVDGFYDGLKLQLERMDRDGFLPKPLAEYLYFSGKPDDAMRYIEEHVD